MSLPVVDLGINYGDDKVTITSFLSTFKGKTEEMTAGLADIHLDGTLPSEAVGLKYMRQLQQIANREQEMLLIDLQDIEEQGLDDLLSRIESNTRRYTGLFCDVVDTLMPVPTKDISEHDEVIDVILHQRRERNERMQGERLDGIQEGFPSHLLRRYNLSFKPVPDRTPMAVREVKGIHLGKLITVRGIVTRVSEVKPLLLVNAYTCDVCGSETFQEVSNKQFTPIQDCENADECKKNSIRGTLHMQTRACRFSPFQEVKIQEMTDQVPVGHIPRSMTVHLQGTLTRKLSPGDVVHLGGTLLPVPYTGFQAVRAGLLTDTYLDTHYIHQLKKQYDDMEVTPAIERALWQLKNDPALYQKLAQSIAPEIYGHLDVKKALLLLLVGGVTKAMGDGMKIRGDLNVCLMGDPGVAKSQLLKYISKVAPRGVYTTGKGSSGVGLTAAVMKDPVTDEMVLEGGALVLADNGICCIDEFDKMEESDRTAIHEVMEQQTISISKAGISTTLNARTSILAAANPLYGRYNTKVSPVENINLPAALLSRFDLLFLILDRPSRDDDERLAQHVTHVHMHNSHPQLEHETVDPVLIRHYIALARQRRPTVPRHVSSYVVETYVKLRKASKDESENRKAHTYTSARTLLGVVRLAQALARLRFANTVEQADVDEALRLMEASKETLMEDEQREDGAGGDRSTASKVYRLIRDMFDKGKKGKKRRFAGKKRFGRGPDRERDMDVDADSDDEEDGTVSMVDVRARVLAAGFTEMDLMNTINEYEGLEILMRAANGTKLQIINRT